jgi:hypothetical protein
MCFLIPEVPIKVWQGDMLQTCCLSHLNSVGHNLRFTLSLQLRFGLSHLSSKGN